jgi:hypothetical protein
MAEEATNGAAAPTKKQTEYTTVAMTDGRSVQFAGKRKMMKTTLLDDSKITVEGDIAQLEKGAVSVRFDFVNGETRTVALPASLLARFAGHGAEQKYGDELASPADKPMSVEDMVMAIEELDGQIQKGEWGKGRAEGGGGIAGASLVVQALIEVTTPARAAAGKPPMTVAEVKAYLDKMLEDSKVRDGANALTRRAIYDSFRNPQTKTGAVIKRLEDDKLAKTSKVDADAAVSAMLA